ncbi:KxYKxGKxW signal peptide domain-containing protein [Limosilactobacillus oris]|nr:KxYKxGKxW signal peptide domain-containing protein [Limosilactobacillus oris]MCW4388448.1 KxYKxGKxW signal peptide domain-containing protein [Limosilactobacillus oris]
MTKINHYKLYKHKKQWVIGCSSVLLPLLHY